MRRFIGSSIVLLLLLGTALAVVAGCGGGGGDAGSEAQQSATSSLSDAELEALVYPGAQEEDLDTDGGMAPPEGSSAPMSRPETPEGMPDGSAPGGGGPGMRGGSTLAAYWTEDSIDKVSRWYEQELSDKGLEEMTMPSRGGRSEDESSAKTGDEASVKMYSFKSGETSLMLMIREDSRDRGGTVISIGETTEGLPSAPPADKGQ